MTRDQLYDLLAEALASFSDDVSGGVDPLAYDQIAMFAFAFSRVPNGWSGDPAIMAEYLEDVPPILSSPVQAIRYAAEFIRSQMLTTLQATSMQPIVDSLEDVEDPTDVKGLPTSFQTFVESVFSTS